LIGKVLNSFQVWKSLGAVEEAKEFYKKYSKVTEKELRIKKILSSVPKQQGIRLFQNLERKAKGKVKFDSAKTDPSVMPTLKSYQRNFIGVIKSYVDRIPFNVQLYNQVIGEWNKTKKYLRRPTEGKINLSQKKRVNKKTKKSLKHRVKQSALKKSKKSHKK
jgi:hypothetical protein